MSAGLYDYPMSWSCWRGICQSNGWQVPPPDRPELPSYEEYRQRFIKWQDKERQGLPQRVIPIPMQAPPAKPVYKPIIRKPKGRGVEL